MNMKNKIILAALACLSVVSCSDMLEIEQKGVVKEETYYSTDEDALSAITVVYSTLSASNWFMDNSVRNVLSDDIYSAGGTRGDNANYEQLNEYNFAVNNAYIPGLYSFYYNVIYYSNVLRMRRTGVSPRRECSGRGHICSWPRYGVTLRSSTIYLRVQVNTNSLTATRRNCGSS